MYDINKAKDAAPNTATFNIAIVGAGISGLASAYVLLKAGYNVKVFEKRSQLQELGAGIQMSPNATGILESWGLLDKIKALSCEPEGICLSHWKKGNTIAEFLFDKKTNHHNSHATPYLHVHRSDLHQCLMEAVLKLSPNCLSLGSELISITENNKACHLITQNTQAEETHSSFDYLIGADGLHSSVKALLHPKLAEPRFTGNTAWRGLIPIELLSEKPQKKAHLIMGPKGHMVFYYVKGGRYLNYIAITENSQAENLKEKSWSTKGDIDSLLNDFDGWHRDHLAILSKTHPDQCYRWPLYDRDPLLAWHSQRSVLVGDAAHPVLPFLAQGAAMAIEDAHILGSVVKQSLGLEKNWALHDGHELLTEQIGKRFFEYRQARCKQVLEVSRKNGRLYHENRWLIRECRDIALRLIAKIDPYFLDKKLNWLYHSSS